MSMHTQATRTGWNNAHGNLWADVPVEALRSFADPYRCPPWGCVPFTVTDVLDAAGRGDVEPGWAGPWVPQQVEVSPSRAIRRVAWFVVNGWVNVDEHYPELDVGIKSLAYMPTWIVLDGNHRYAAAIARGDTTMAFVLGGCLEDAEEMFGIKLNQGC